MSHYAAAGESAGMNANDLVADAIASARLEHAKRQAAFLQAFQQELAAAEPARLLMLLKIGAALFSDGEGDKGASMLLSLATADARYEQLLVAYRHLLKPMATEAVERAAATLAPFSKPE